MQPLLILLTLAAYAGAGFLWYRERTPNYLVALLAGQLGALLSPFWQWLYQFGYSGDFQPALYSALGQNLPRIVVFGAWVAVLPPLVVFWLYRHRWWFPNYGTGLLTYALFVIYFLLIESMGTTYGWWAYANEDVLSFQLPVALLSALMNGLVALGMVSVLIVTRRYAWASLLTLLLPMPLVLSFFVNGILGAPLYTVLVLQDRFTIQNWVAGIGLLGTLGLVLSGAHTVASAIDGQRQRRRTAG